MTNTYRAKYGIKSISSFPAYLMLVFSKGTELFIQDITNDGVLVYKTLEKDFFSDKDYYIDIKSKPLNKYSENEYLYGYAFAKEDYIVGNANEFLSELLLREDKEPSVLDDVNTLFKNIVNSNNDFNANILFSNIKMNLSDLLKTPYLEIFNPRRVVTLAANKVMSNNEKPITPSVKGTVKWFDAEKGYGFITGVDGRDIYAHYTAIQGEGIKTLEIGNEVCFDIIDGKRGPEAAKIKKRGIRRTVKE